VEKSDFKEAPPLLFGENFGSVAKQRIEVAAALKKTLAPNKGRWGIRPSHPQKNWSRKGGSSTYSGQRRGWQPRGNKAPKKAQQAKK